MKKRSEKSIMKIFQRWKCILRVYEKRDHNLDLETANLHFEIREVNCAGKQFSVWATARVFVSLERIFGIQNAAGNTGFGAL